MEYVTRKEVDEWRILFEKWIESIRKDIKHNGVTFECNLVGSAKRNLVIRHHNKGFDLDYQIFISKNKLNLSAKELKHLFMKSFNAIVTENGFDECQDSYSAITIDMVDKANAKIIVGYDIAILKLKKKKEGDKMSILRFHKPPEDGHYDFELLSDMTNAMKQYSKIKGDAMWADLRTRYYDKKITQDNMNLKESERKKSFQLLNEAVNETLDYFAKKGK